MDTNIKLSIVCNVYNQKDYIEQTLESFLSQITTFQYEILVHDDASTDGTQDILKRYEEKYPEKIYVTYQQVNQYSQGTDIILDFQYPRVRGEYIAFCEGDDFWTDKYKLQKQVDALELNPEVNICAHSATVIRAKDNKKLYNICPFKKDCKIKTYDVINGGGGYVATNSLVIRKKILENPPTFYKFLPIDYALQILGSLNAGMLYLKDNMSTYRYMAKNSWSTRMFIDRNKQLEVNYKLIKMLDFVDEYTNKAFVELIEEKKKLLEFWNLSYQGKYREMKKKPQKNIYKKISFKDKIRINLHIYAPKLLEAIKRRII